VLGKEFGKDMKEAAAAIEALPRAAIEKILSGETLPLEIAGHAVELTAEKLDIKRIEKTGLKILNEGSLTVALDTEITEALLLEGDVRDLVRGVQNLRKDSGLEVSDRIILYLHGSERLKAAFEAWSDFVTAETLAVKIEWRQKEGQRAIEAGAETWLAGILKA
jgi:isoleucyl-tRNA synthetase